MKVLIVSQYYYPEQFQINEIAPELVKRGHQVTVLTGLPNYPKGEIFQGYRNGERRVETINGVKIVRVPLHPRKNGPIHLIWNYLSFLHQGIKAVKALKPEYDLIFAYQLSPITMVGPAIAYAKKHNVPLYLYCLDIWPESAQSLLGSKNCFYSFVKYFSKKIYQSCDHIAVTSRPFVEYLNSVNGISKDYMSYIPQHAEEGFLELDLQAEANEIVDFMYAGNMGKGQTLDVLVRAVAELHDRNDFVVHMAGDGSQRNHIESLAEELGVRDKFIFYGNQKREEMKNFYKKADALLITLRGNNFVGNTMPGKLQMYMTTGKPILGAINGAANEVIKESQCGRCTSAGDAKGLSQIMLDFIEHPEAYAKCGELARSYFKNHFTLDIYMDHLEHELQEVVKR